MIKSQANSVVGDSRMPPIRASVSTLIQAAELKNLDGTQSPPSLRPNVAENIKTALAGADVRGNQPLSCKQLLWLTFFFDGTGNNLEADLEMLKHSNIARLYRVHRPTDLIDGVFRFYIPGIATYFKEVGDNGGSAAGNAFGAMGEARLKFALQQFDKTLVGSLARARSASNAIKEINIAVFGFSRGAALARAFVNILMETRCVYQKGTWKLRDAGAPVNFRFMGLFDTVASVGQPMSSNNTDFVNPVFGDVSGMIRERLEDYPDTAPQLLAFSVGGAAGADPAPGDHAGHDDWGSRMAIHETVMEVRHFIAAHEARNSFPVDSISILRNNGIIKPPNFHETVYPGSHSDVGGGYAPGEGAKAVLPSENLCLIPLRHMYEHALRQNVPFLPITARLNVQDFETSDDLREIYDRYLKFVGAIGGVGQLMNRHRELYFAWRFGAINRKLKGLNDAKKNLINEYRNKYRDQEKSLASEVSDLMKIETAARVKLKVTMRSQQGGVNPLGVAGGKVKSSVGGMNAIKSARQEYLQARDNRLQSEAKRNAVPCMENYEAMLDLYDRQLMADVKSIYSVLRGEAGEKKSISRRENLRPHYKALLKAFDDEFNGGAGLRDKHVIALFDMHIHDSLAGFARDASLPSDPRVVYVGADQKLRFAENPHQKNNLSSFA